MEHSPSIHSSIQWFNNFSNSVIIDILKPELRQRVDTLIFWIKVGDNCRKLNNFNGVMEILAALGSCPVCRLQKAWHALPRKFLEMFQELEQIMSSIENFKEYRSRLEALSITKAPTVPYMGIYLRDMMFIDENPALVNGVVNQFKVDLERQVLSGFISFQEREYKHILHDPILRKILDTWKLSHSNANMENGLYERSILMEPIERSASMSNFSELMRPIQPTHLTVIMNPLFGMKQTRPAPMTLNEV